MSPYYDQPGSRQRGPEDVAGVLVLFACAVVGFCWYVAVSRLHLRNDQCLEIFLYTAIVFFGGGLILAQLIGRRKKREEYWPHPAIVIPASKDARMVRDANQSGATLLGYNVHKEPWLWPDTVRMKHGVIVGGTGAGKSTFLENIIAQDLKRRFGARKMPMIIFDGKGERDFLDRLLPHIEAAGRLQDLRVIDPTHPSESARYNPFYALDDAYQEHVNFIFRSFGLREDFFKGHQEAYLSDLVRILQYTGKLFNVYDVLVMALDEKVLEEQIGIAKARLAVVPGISMQKRLNFEMSVKMLQRSLPLHIWGACGVGKAEIVFWIEQGWLQASIACRGKRRSYTITPEALMSLYKQHHADVLKRGIPNQALFEAYVQYCFSPKHTVGEQLLDVRRDKRERAAYAAAVGDERSGDEEEEEGDEDDQDDNQRYGVARAE